MLISEARSRVLDAGKVAGGDGRYGDERIDRALQVVFEDLVHELRPIKTYGTVALTGTSPAVDIASSHTTFRPERAVRFEIRKWNEPPSEPGHKIEHQDYQAVARVIRTGTVAGTSAKPSAIAFRTPSQGFLDAAPGTTYPDMGVTWNDRPTTWTPGAAGSGTVSLNIPDEYLQLPVWYGAAAVCWHEDPSAAFMNPSWIKYTEWRDRMRGRVTFDSAVEVKDEGQYL